MKDNPMFDMVRDFPRQWRDACEIGEGLSFARDGFEPASVLIAGMGGSAIGAEFVSALLQDTGPVPIQICRGYTVPAWAGHRTLALVSSYSGNTEETLAAAKGLVNAGARVVCICSGGRLETYAREQGLDLVLLPAGSSSPRARVGYSLVIQLFVLKQFGLVPDSLLSGCRALPDFLDAQQLDIQRNAGSIATFLEGRRAVIYSSDRLEAAALRLRQQLNENAKVLCWHHVIPEMNHNELVGWTQRDPGLAVLLLRQHEDHARVRLRFDVCKEILGHFAGALIEVYAQGDSLLQRLVYLLHLADWISVHLAALRGVDPVEIRVIDFLKKELEGSRE